jgi:outer membrane protein OmpA-like peptidoglycan-associated protein
LEKREDRAQAWELLETLTAQTAAARRLPLTFRFPSASAEFEKKEMEDLERLADYAQATAKSGGELLLAGFADAVGTYAQNRHLSQERAVRVRQELERRSGLRITGGLMARTQGFSTLAPVTCNEDPDRRGLNRRVEVWVR